MDKSHEEIAFILQNFLSVVLKHYAQASVALGIDPSEHVKHMTVMCSGVLVETGISPNWEELGADSDVDA